MVLIIGWESNILIAIFVCHLMAIPCGLNLILFSFNNINFYIYYQKVKLKIDDIFVIKVVNLLYKDVWD